MNPHLFVYGTLLSLAGHPMGACLRREALLLGAACTTGRLYSLGRYPGLVVTGPGESLVHGELYVLATPAVALAWLGAYEGIAPGKPVLSPYERAERPVRLVSGEAVAAWVYIYRRRVTAQAEVVGGRWMPPRD